MRSQSLSGDFLLKSYFMAFTDFPFDVISKIGWDFFRFDSLRYHMLMRYFGRGICNAPRANRTFLTPGLIALIKKEKSTIDYMVLKYFIR